MMTFRSCADEYSPSVYASAFAVRCKRLQRKHQLTKDTDFFIVVYQDVTSGSESSSTASSKSEAVAVAAPTWATTTPAA